MLPPGREHASCLPPGLEPGRHAHLLAQQEEGTVATCPWRSGRSTSCRAEVKGCLLPPRASRLAEGWRRGDGGVPGARSVLCCVGFLAASGTALCH